MICQITNIVSVRKRDRERRRKICFSSGGPLITIPIVTNVNTGPHPTWPTALCFHDAEQYRFHAKVELRVRLLAIDYIKRIRCIRLHAGDLEIEPLMSGTAVDIRRQDEIIFPWTYLRRKQM